MVGSLRIFLSGGDYQGSGFSPGGFRQRKRIFLSGGDTFTFHSLERDAIFVPFVLFRRGFGWIPLAWTCASPISVYREVGVEEGRARSEPRAGAVGLRGDPEQAPMFFNSAASTSHASWGRRRGGRVGRILVGGAVEKVDTLCHGGMGLDAPSLPPSLPPSLSPSLPPSPPLAVITCLLKHPVQSCPMPYQGAAICPPRCSSLRNHLDSPLAERARQGND